MDIISHTLTGIAVGTVIATSDNGNWKRKSAIILLGGFAGGLPDFDAISLGSKFDTIIGSFFGLNHTGKQIYSGKFWYSHHAALHSMLAPVLLLLFSFLYIYLKGFFYKTKSIGKSIYTNKYLSISFLLGYIFHLFEDMPTPASVWGGVNFFFPNSDYIGGFGKIWWWNNYDLTLIIFLVILVNLMVLIAPKIHKKTKSKLSLGVFSLGMGLFIFQIMTRPVDFSYTGHTTKYKEFEAESKRIQKEILGDRLYHFMVQIDDKIPVNF